MLITKYYNTHRVDEYYYYYIVVYGRLCVRHGIFFRSFHFFSFRRSFSISERAAASVDVKCPCMNDDDDRFSRTVHCCVFPPRVAR